MVNVSINISGPVVGTSYVNYFTTSKEITIVPNVCSGSGSMPSVTFSLGIGRSISILVLSSRGVIPTHTVEGRFNPTERGEEITLQRGQNFTPIIEGLGNISNQEVINVLQTYQNLETSIDNHNIEQRNLLAKAIINNSSPKDRRTVINNFTNQYGRTIKR